MTSRVHFDKSWFEELFKQLLKAAVRPKGLQLRDDEDMPEYICLS